MSGVSLGHVSNDFTIPPRSRTTESEGSKELKGGRIVRGRTRILGQAISYKKY